jgi:alkylated DNA repair dioxygenase AlkB
MFVYFEKLFSPERCNLLNQVALNYKSANRLNLEANDHHYKNSYGVGRIKEYEDVLHELTPLVKQKTGMTDIVAENSYTRIYYDGATLGKHTDRKGLDLTLSVCTFSNIQFDWPLYVEVKEGVVKSFATPPGDGALILGTKMQHWRDPLSCGADEMVIQSFYHWRINHAHKIFI